MVGGIEMRGLARYRDKEREVGRQMCEILGPGILRIWSDTKWAACWFDPFLYQLIRRKPKSPATYLNTTVVLSKDKPSF